jgi:opacity protein-like surface antigen
MAASAGDTYLGVGFSQLTYSEDGFPDLNPTMLGLRAGYYLNRNFSVEGRLGIGIGDDSVQLINFPTPYGLFTGDVAIEVDSLIGVYAVGHIPASDSFDFYGFFGFNRADITATATSGGTSFSYSDDDSDMAYGIGAEFKINPTSAINLEYGNFYDDSGVTVDAITIGFTMNM